MERNIFRNVCPRNCYSSCSILSHVKDGKLVKITGDPKHGFTQGHLCAKGYAYNQFIYNPLRLKYPIIQYPRGSGNWKRITWDEAYTIIATKILELNERYGSNLASGYTKYSGNLGILHYAVEGMFNSIGPHTKSVGDICLGTGAQAIQNSFGQMQNPFPEHMGQSKTIVIWGANPAVTNVHQMKFIYKCKQNRGKFVVIDPVFTETAMKADLYIQIKPGTDGWLALGIAKMIIEKELVTLDQDHFIGFDGFKKFVQDRIDIRSISKMTGVKKEAMEELANLYGKEKPLAAWLGFGLQRNKYGEFNIEAIISLSALTGNLNEQFGGIYYAHDNINRFPLNLLNFPEKKHPSVPRSRTIHNKNFAIKANELTDPPLKFLWIAARNPLSQDQHLQEWKKLFNNLELIVCVDLFLTNTAKEADIILPAATHFEEEDLHVGYWHYWLTMNEKALPPFYEAKSDLKIARELTQKLNELSPNFSTFPSNLEPIDWINLELTDEIKKLYGIQSYEDLIKQPRFIRSHMTNVNKVTKFTYLSPEKITEVFPEKSSLYPFRLLTPQSLLRLHSQFTNINWLNHEDEGPIVEMHGDIAMKKEILDGEKVLLYNENGVYELSAKINNLLPKDVLLVKQGNSDHSINILISNDDEDENSSSTFFYDTYVEIKKSGVPL